MSNLTASASKEIDRFVREGRMFDAIKLLLNKDHSLREAKEYVTRVQRDVGPASCNAHEKWLDSVECEFGVSYK